ncbi:MAG TPA: aldolase/citrate lyase family protein [Gemmataceae bacterium]|jgi:2-dehydro-3-deoxyglucarate aldolase/4-hydroxy-2-oxoheptanedioate aldolase|nr:aldolase/citrate lyase family protein [Gemmataceae bacterium]
MRLKQLLARGELTRVFCLGQLCHPKVVEMVGLLGGYDAVWLDQEHAGLSVRQIEDATRAARAAGIDTFVRLAPTDYATVMRPLEAGAGGIMAAQVRSAGQAEQVVQWAKFHPRGVRGVNSTGVDGRYGSLPFAEYIGRANAETFIAIQIEHADAVQDVEQIAAVRDVDLLFIGPADLSQSLGIPGAWDHPRLWQAIERVAQAAGQHRVHWGILPLDVSHARRCVDMGCRMLSLGIDIWAVQKGLAASRAEFADLFPG